jgi:hypothetical protein
MFDGFRLDQIDVGGVRLRVRYGGLADLHAHRPGWLSRDETD